MIGRIRMENPRWGQSYDWRIFKWHREHKTLYRKADLFIG